jgi:peptidoglycan LD-endopeptidase LytH
VNTVNTRQVAAAAALAGFVAGIFCTALLVWRFGNFVGGHDPAVDTRHRPAVERWIDGLDEDGGSGGILEGRSAEPVDEQEPSPAPQMTARPAEPPPAPAGTTGRETNLPLDLLDRRLEVPVQGIERAKLVRSFEEPRGAQRRHQAIDILAPRNTPVLAVEDGVVARLFKSVAGGITIYQYDPTERYVYYYAHLERYAAGLSEGDRVRRGQVIGYVGTTGNAPESTPHLHFAIFRLNEPKRWWEGTVLDPYEILRKGG